MLNGGGRLDCMCGVHFSSISFWGDLRSAVIFGRKSPLVEVHPTLTPPGIPPPRVQCETVVAHWVVTPLLADY